MSRKLIAGSKCLSGIMFTVIFLLCLCPVLGNCENQQMVVVLPFEVHSQEDIFYLSTEISEMVSKQIREEGADVVRVDMATDDAWEILVKTPELIRQYGAKLGVDAVIIGSLTYAGNKINLETKVVPVSGSPIRTFSDGADGIENLLKVVKSVVRKIGMKILKMEVISKIEISGNERIESDAILRVIKTKEGDVYIPDNLSKDLKAIYRMGYFDDIRVEKESDDEGKNIRFIIQEKPTIRDIIIKGNSGAYDTEEIEEVLTISSGSILNIFSVKNNINRIKELYFEKNYHNVEVTYETPKHGKGQIDLVFVIKEGDKIRIREIVFEGNRAYTVKKLKKMMKTKQKGFFSWLTSSGDLKVEDLNQDIERLSAFYQINGYIQARVGEPEVEHKDDAIFIKIKIEEGPQFKVGSVSVGGDLLLESEELIAMTNIKKEEFCNRKVLHEDVIALTDYYSDNGYANSDIYPRFDKNMEKKQVDITFEINKGDLVYFDKIIISGNTKTRDKVIRRELKVYEGELYSGKRLKRGIRNLYRLDFFEDIKVDTIKSTADDKINLKIDVAEKPTGTFSFGAGYSSQEKMFGTLSVSQRNFLGRGQTLNLKGEAGSTTRRYTFGFTEPWLFDIPLSAGFDIYNWEKEYDYYDKISTGFGLRIGYPVYDYTRAYISYSFERARISDVTTLLSPEAEGIDRTRSISTTLRYDSRDKAFNPTEGSEHSISVEFAGEFLGGNIAFTKYLGETGWYFPLIYKTVGFLHGKVGYVREGTGGDLPDYERFYLGWMNSVRGFGWRDIHATEKRYYDPDDENANNLDHDNEGIDIDIGGDKFIQFNVEWLFPLFQEAGLVALVFFDAGDVYNNHEEIDVMRLRSSYGWGVRWYSPIGPIRLEWGKIIAPREDEKTSGSWEFTMGTAF